MLCIIFSGPEALSQSLQEDVHFLCDSLRMGRRYGSRGVVDAAFWVQHEFESMGLKTSVQHYRSSGKTGHNVQGLLRAPGSSKYIIVMACMDGIGTFDDVVYPGADANASGVAALMALARSMTSHTGDFNPSQWLRNGKPSRNVLFVALDGHNDHSSGATALWESLAGQGISRSDILMVVNLDTMGSNMAPPQRYWKDYLIILGGLRYEKTIGSCNSGLGLHLYYDYYDSRSFTDMFYRRVGDQAVFVSNGVPSVMVTSGITMLTNKAGDLPATLSYDLLERRVELIRRWLLKL